MNFNAVYILVHFLHHYWSGGVGLRQLMDWGLYVTRHYEELVAGPLAFDVGGVSATVWVSSLDEQPRRFYRAGECR